MDNSRSARLARPLSLLLAACLSVTYALPAAAQNTPAAPTDAAGVVGDWTGALAMPGGRSLRLAFHVSRTADGGLSATMDSPDQGAFRIPAAATLQGGRLIVDVRSAGGRFEGALRPDGKLAGSWIQGGSLPLELERGNAATAPARPQEPRPPLPYRSEDVRYRNQGAGIELAGTLTTPPGSGPFPAVVLISGSGPQNRDAELFGHRSFLVLADFLTRRGIAVLRSDDRGVGTSGGVFEQATTEDFASDAAAAAAFLRARPEIRDDAVGLVGLSEGGLVAPIVAAGGGPVAFIVLMAGPGIVGEEILYQQGALIARAMGVPEAQIEYNRTLQQQLFEVIKAEADPATRRSRMEAVLRAQFAGVSEAERAARGLTQQAETEWIESQLRASGGPWFRYFLTHDPAPVLRQVRVPVLALNGELDLQVPADANLRAIEGALTAGGNRDFTVVKLPRLNHIFQTAVTGTPAEYPQITETMSPDAMERIAGWILERTR